MCYCNCIYENKNGDGCRKPARIPFPCEEIECEKCSYIFFVDDLVGNCCPECGCEYGQ